MSNVGNKYKVGFLVLAGTAVLIVGLLALGAFKSLRKTYEFCTVVTYSVQGLDKGAKVKFKGVAIGQVTSIKIMPGDGGNRILICMKFDPETFAASYDSKINCNNIEFSNDFRESIEKAVEAGLRCKLQYASISGDLYVEIDYADPIANPAIVVKLPENAPKIYIPSAESASISAVIAESQKTMANIGRINFAQLADKLEAFLDNANALCTDKRISRTLDQTVEVTGNIKEITASIKSEFSAASIRNLVDDVQKTFDNLNATMNDLRNNFNKANIPETAEKVRSLIEASDRLLRQAESLRVEVSQSLVKLDSALDAARLLLDLLERNPDAILRGKAAAPVIIER